VGLVGLTTWALVPWVEASRDQRALLDPLAAEVRALPTGVPLVLADSSGIYGDVYTLVPPYLSIAMSDMLDRPVDIQLCTPDGVARHHPVAARFPLTTTPDCSQVLSRRTPERVLPVPTHRHGTVSLLILPRSLSKP
jgi:hypothetical protein